MSESKVPHTEVEDQSHMYTYTVVDNRWDSMTSCDWYQRSKPTPTFSTVFLLWGQVWVECTSDREPFIDVEVSDRDYLVNIPGVRPYVSNTWLVQIPRDKCLLHLQDNFSPLSCCDQLWKIWVSGINKISLISDIKPSRIISRGLNSINDNNGIVSTDYTNIPSTISFTPWVVLGTPQSYDINLTFYYSL